MKTILKLLIVIVLIGWLSSCTATKDMIYEGMYDGLNHLNDMDNTQVATPSVEKHPTYQQYKQEREEMIKKK